MKVLVDANVILDVLCNHTEFLENSVRVFKDYEDAVQRACASRINADYIITRNERDYSGSRMLAVSPTEFLNLGIGTL